MNDDNWETINGGVAHQIEALNASSTINILEAIVLFTTAQNSSGYPNENCLKELHRSATFLLLKEPGHYRDCAVQVVEKGSSRVVHQPPPHPELVTLMPIFFTELEQLWQRADALDVAAFALWKINWIHPFKNGNGRTARAFAYTCLCVRLGTILPGALTVIDQIMATRPEYEACIREGDTSFAAGGKANLSRMKSYLNGLLQLQIQSAANFNQ